MTALIASLVVGALFFVEQDIEGARVGEINPITGEAATNFRHADLNRDGTPDLVMPDRVYWIEKGEIRLDTAVPLPLEGAQVYCDTAPGELYLWAPRRLRIIERREDRWAARLDQELERPLGQEHDPEAAPALEGVTGVRFYRFTHDFDGDGVPELVAPGPDGLSVYQFDGKRYARASIANIFPPLRLASRMDQALWPPEERRVVLPSREMSCRLILDGAGAAILTRQEQADGMAIYEIRRYRHHTETGFTLEPTDATRTAPMPGHLAPCRLNEDGAIDFAGGRWELSSASALPIPIHEVQVTTDGGATLQTLRTSGFRPRCMFVDFDGDGRMDLITERAKLFDGGAREVLSRGLTSAALEHEIRVHLQTAAGSFPRTPSLTHTLKFELDAPPISSPRSFRQYQNGELADFMGDFNGDGFRDLLARIRLTVLAVYLGSAKGFSKTPATELTLEPEWRFVTADVDGDGLSDIVARRIEEEGDSARYRSRVYLAREDRR